MPSDNTNNKDSDTKHSRGDQDNDLKRKAKRGSGRSSSRTSSSSSSRPRPADSKEHLRSGSRGGKSTPGATNVREGSSRSSQSRSRSRLSDEKEKHRSGSREVSTPGAKAVKSSGDRRRKKESSKSSGSSSAKTPEDSNRTKRERQKLRDAGNSRSPPVLAPLNPEKAMGGKEDMFTVKATTVPDIEEMVQADHQQDREEERVVQPSSSQGEVGEIMVATSADDRDGRMTKRNIFIAAFVILAILAAGIATWMAVASPFKSSDATVPQSSESSPKPSEEACEMVSKGLVPTGGQKETEAKAFVVELAFVVSPNENIDFLETELGLRMQQNVLPALLGCPTRSPITIENTFIAILTAIISNVSVGNPTQCIEGSSDELCSTVSFEIDVFVEDSETPMDALINLIKDLYEDQGLLKLLDLATPVEDFYFTNIVAITPTMFPSPSPSISDGEPTPFDDCLAIASGEPVKDQDTMATQEYDILLDVSLESTMSLTPITNELEKKIQQVIMPSLAGCSDEQVRRRLRTQTGIANGLVQAKDDSEGACMEESASPCYRYKIILYLHVSQGFKFADFTDMIVADFKKAPLVQRLNLSVATYVNITVVGSFTQTPSSTPSVSPSQSPTFLPVESPTTEPLTSTPSILPSATPTDRPTRVLSAGPTTQPAVDPTPLPTPGPTQPPTPGPTQPPTPVPSLVPSLAPTPEPTPGPTQPPTPGPTLAPSISPTKSPTLIPTPSPTIQSSSSPSLIPSGSPTRTCIETITDLRSAAGYRSSPNWNSPSVLAQYGPIGDWCFGPAVTSMRDLFINQVSFNEDISRWDVSGITNMQGMFAGASQFNQDIGNWDVSSVTTMEFMFWGASIFNKDVSNWDVASVTNMAGTFGYAIAFNQDISTWNVSSSMTTMTSMFAAAYAFNQNLCPWGQRLPNANIFGAWMFDQARACPTRGSPNPNASPPGPFCHPCT